MSLPVHYRRSSFLLSNFFVEQVTGYAGWLLFLFFRLSFYPAEPNVILLSAVLPLFTGKICFYLLLPITQFRFSPSGQQSASSLGTAFHTKEFTSNTRCVSHLYWSWYMILREPAGKSQWFGLKNLRIVPCICQPPWKKISQLSVPLICTMKIAQPGFYFLIPHLVFERKKYNDYFSIDSSVSGDLKMYQTWRFENAWVIFFLFFSQLL